MVLVVLEEMIPMDEPVNGKTTVGLRVEKTWLIGVVVALIVQIFGGVWWAATQSAQLNNIDRRIQTVDIQISATAAADALKSDRMARIEVQIETLQAANKDLSNHLAVIEGYLHNRIIK